MTRALALILTLLTGFSGLVYEVAWQRYLATLLGSHSEATAAVLGIFLGGLSVGYWLFGRVTRSLVERAQESGKPPRLLLVYGFLEAGIGAYVILFPWLFEAVQALSYAIPHGPDGLGFLVDILLAAALIGPASILMGGTIPILTQALARSLEDATRFHAFVYAFNTAGAFAGALAAGFFLIPWLGLVKVMLLMGLINLFAGSVFILLGLRGRDVVSLAAESPGEDAGKGFAAYMAVALLTGFAMMTMQTAIVRLAGLSLGSSQFTFSMVVAAFVLGIALGSFLVSALSRITPLFVVLNQWALGLFLIALYGPLQHSPYWAHFLRSLFRDESAAFGFYYILAFLMMLTVLGLPIILSGASLPLLFHQMRREVDHLGDLAGSLYSWNTVGSLLGALLGGYVLFFWFDLHHIFRFAVIALLLSALILTVRVYRLGWIWTALAAPLVGVVLLMPAWDPSNLYVGLFRQRTPLEGTTQGPEAFRSTHKRLFEVPTLFHVDDPIASVTVQEYDKPGGGKSISIATNGKSDGNTFSDFTTMALAATLPALLAEKAENAFVIGWGTGITAGELAAFDTMKRVDVAEISSGVMQASPLFDFASLNATENPKIQVYRSDAYRALMRTDERYDIIVSEPSNPWVTGVEMLFSREFLAAAKGRLSEGGVYAQWFHLYETDDETVELVLRTYTDVFDHVVVWSAGFRDLLILGLDKPGAALDHFRLQEKSQRPDFAASLMRMGVESFPALLAHELIPVGVLHAADLQGPIHTLYHPLLNDQAGRAFFRGDLGALPFLGYGEPARLARENSMLRGYELRHGGRLPELERAEMIREAYRSIGPLAAPLLAKWASEEPDSEIYNQTAAWAENVVAANNEVSDEASKWTGKSEDLVRFFGHGGDSESDITPRRARSATDLYTRMYHHGAPFEKDRLIEIWGSCREGEQDPNWCREWARSESFRMSDRSEASLMESCLGNRTVGEKCREGLASVRTILETGK